MLVTAVFIAAASVFPPSVTPKLVNLESTSHRLGTDEHDTEWFACVPPPCTVKIMLSMTKAIIRPQISGHPECNLKAIL